MFEDYRRKYPELADQGYRMLRRELPDGWDAGLPVFPADRKGVATRDASGQALNAVAGNVPWLIGGSADLGPSCKTRLTFDGAGDFSAENPAGRNLHFGIREHAMGAILNGLSLSKLRPFGSGFLIFSDYGRAAIRLSALMEIPVIHIFTHDSIGVGEDGPTHQPVEHLASLRAIPGLITLRPADANEAVEAWRVITQLRHEPVALILTRQAVPTLDRTKYASADGVQRGAYVLADADDGTPDVLLLATGSEVSLCIEAYERLNAEGIKARVVSMPSWEIFEHYCRDHPEYREQVLPESVTARVSVEKASTLGWARYVGRRRPQHRHGDVRRVGAAEGTAEEVRLHAREHRRGSQAADRASEVNHARRDWFRSCRIRAEGGGEGFLIAEHHEVLDVGTHSTDPVDYSDYAEAVGASAARIPRRARHPSVRQRRRRVDGGEQRSPAFAPDLCHDTYSAHQGVEHDDMNVLVLGGRVVGVELARELIHAFLQRTLHRRGAASAPARQDDRAGESVARAAGVRPVGLARLHPPQLDHERRAARHDRRRRPAGRDVESGNLREGHHRQLRLPRLSRVARRRGRWMPKRSTSGSRSATSSDAADALRPVYDDTSARDGYVSLEVSPLLAYDTAGTLDEARRLWRQSAATT